MIRFIYNNEVVACGDFVITEKRDVRIAGTIKEIIENNKHKIYSVFIDSMITNMNMVVEVVFFHNTVSERVYSFIVPHEMMFEYNLLNIHFMQVYIAICDSMIALDDIVDYDYLMKFDELDNYTIEDNNGIVLSRDDGELIYRKNRLYRKIILKNKTIIINEEEL